MAWNPDSILREKDQASRLPPSRDFSTFSLVVTICLAGILCLGVGFVIWAHMSTERLARVTAPEEALALLAEQMLTLHEAAPRLPAWERRLYQWLGDGDERQYVLRWYRELAAYTNDPLMAFYVAVLSGESGARSDVEATVHAWKRRPLPYSLFAQLLETAYLAPPDGRLTVYQLQARLAEMVPDGWFYRRVANRLAERIQDHAFLEFLERSSRPAIRARIWANRVVVGFELLSVVVGVVSLGLVYRRWRAYGAEGLRLGSSQLPPPWPGRMGVMVLIWGGALTVLLLIGCSLMGIDQRLLQVLVPFLLHVPVVMLAVRFLWLPAGVSCIQGWGLRLIPGQGRLLGLMTSGLFGAALIAEWGIGHLTAVWHVSVHWTDWFDETLILGTQAELWSAVVTYTLVAPVLEELVFRGVLFATLRRWFGPWLSMLSSAGVFALAHGYSVGGALAIFASGLLWAWAYEKTGSLWPGIAAHTLNNLFVCVTAIMLLRP
ncbi:MAG: CPBP family intramembrane metalloprotease [Nitrospirae bacterium]|nr:MAG: CPBP family intramembrane metalloprotease [Nitrospirota bacterium]